ncbi:MAG: hypothetical protein VW519_00725 [Luminiphilus sp.]
MATTSPPANRPHGHVSDCILRLEGPDAILFLQGQTTSDFQKAEVGDHLYAAFCNPKGRVLADVLAVVTARDTIFLRGRCEVMAQLAAHLKPYLAFSKATLATTEWTITCTLDESSQHTDPGQVQVLTDDGELTSVIINRGDGFTEYWQHGASAVAHDRENRVPLAQVDFEQARARVETTTAGAYLPQDLNYDLNETVSFAKGCYTGQEIVARLHYRGTPKRRLYRATAQGTARQLVPGDGITNAEGQRVGSLVNILAMDNQLGLLIEVIPGSASEPLLIFGGDIALSSLEACHSLADQSTG